MQLLTKLDIIMQILAKDCILYSAIIFISVINNKYNIWVYKFSLILYIYTINSELTINCCKLTVNCLIQSCQLRLSVINYHISLTRCKRT